MEWRQGRRIPILDGLFIGPESFEAREGDLTFEVELRDDHYVVTSIRGPELSGELLRTVRPGLVISESVSALVAPGRRRRHLAEWIIKSFGGVVTGKPAELPSDDVAKVEAVSYLYRFAYLMHLRPTDALVDILGVSRSTVGRLVQRARQLSLLGPTEERRAGV